MAQRVTRFSLDDRVDGYRLIKHLGTGGAAEVWAAQPVRGVPRAFALKMLTPTEDRREVEAFFDEARAVAALRHPAIVPVVDVGIAEQGPYLVMELVRGPTLAMVLRHHAELGVGLSPSALCVIGERVASALDHAWNAIGPRGQQLYLVHRDISPQNILFDAWAGVYVTDFGAARFREQLHKSVVGSVVGKPSYMAPEQAVGGPVDDRTDVHALGVVLYECATARRLFDPEDPRGLLTVLREHRPPELSALFRGYPPRLSAAVARCLEKSPVERWSSAAALAQELREIAREFGGLDVARSSLAAHLEEMFPPERFAVPLELELEPKPSPVAPIVVANARPRGDTSAFPRRVRWALPVVVAAAGATAVLVSVEPAPANETKSEVPALRVELRAGVGEPGVVLGSTRTAVRPEPEPTHSPVVGGVPKRMVPTAARSTPPASGAPLATPPGSLVPPAPDVTRRALGQRIRALASRDAVRARALLLELNEINPDDAGALAVLDAKVTVAEAH